MTARKKRGKTASARRPEAPAKARGNGHPPLSPDQRRMVEKNLPLVTTCLNDYLRRSKSGRQRHVRWDMFQEGCLGLMEAVARYCPESDRDFARFACSRILHGLRRWGRRQSWGGFRLYDSRSLRRRHDPDAVPRVRPLEPSAVRFLRSRRRPAVSIDADPPPCETIGERIDQKMQRAAQCAVALAEVPDDPAGSRALAERILDDRLMVPEEAMRETLRGLARTTGVPMARVRRCDARLRRSLREALEEDGEVARLRAAARRSRRGMSRPLDAELTERLRREEAEEFSRRFHALDAEGRLRFIGQWMTHGADDIEALLHHSWLTLDAEARDVLLQQLRRPPRSNVNAADRLCRDDARRCDSRPVQPGV